ncbi:MAG: endopeptidase La, partial [Muribaculaceae bacterium]|nr:endopeptidase La [Muribaculaceae bacterium]
QSMEEQSRNAFLQTQMETIRQELYGEGDDADILEEKAKNILFTEDVRKTFEREIAKLRRLNPQSPDYSVLYSYLETLTDLPWQNFGKLNSDFPKAAKVLDEDHYGLKKVKERILEEFAMMLNNPDGKSPIICLVGPPGVGKTSIGRSIASALGREYQRISLGGLHDESEIRGHRRTYIGAMPGRIIDALKRCKTSNPVLLLDEIDKIGKDFKGDPSAALLEVLDPAQNCRFHDNYIDVDYDLSNVLFIATANTLSTIAQPLLDRMEIIEIPGYLIEEKIEIAKRHLIPRLIKEAGPNSPKMEVSDDALRFIIEKYTSESGVRLFEKTLASILRKLVLKKLQGKEVNCRITVDDVKELLGAEKYIKDIYEGNEFAGVVAGLAWTAVGGEILFIESSLTPSKEGASKLTLTGNLGDVMKESAMIALQYVKAHAKELGIDSSLFDRYSIHIHVPEGAVPKDGPSAGITMATSIVSAFTQKRVKNRLAMTGEITLRGKVLPVGGIREKILAAKRAGITDIILSEQNKKNIEEIEKQFIKGVKFHFVETVKDVIKIAITKTPAIDAIKL